MADASDLGSADRRANWVALRTLRQRPTVVGRTEQGETVYEVRSVRLLLTGGANHFSQLVHCSKCGRAVPGRAVLTPADLERAPNPMFCASCSAGTSATMPVVRPAPPPAAPEAETVEPVAVAAPEDSRLAIVEAQLAVVLAQLRAMAGAERERADLSEEVAAVRAELGQLATAQAEAHQRLVELAERVARPVTDHVEPLIRRIVAEMQAATAVQVEADAERLRATMGEELARLGAEIGSERARSEDAASRHDALAQAQAEADRRMLELAERVERLASEELPATVRRLVADADLETAAHAEVERRRLQAALGEDLALVRAQVAAQDKRSEEAASQQAALDAQLAEVVRETSAHVREMRGMQAAIDHALETAGGADEAAVDQLREALSAGRGELRAEVAALARRLDEQSAALAAELAAQRREAGAEAQDVAQETLGALAEPLRALTGAHQETDQRLAALTTWANATAARQEAVEQKLHDALDEVRRLVEAEQAKKAALRKRGGERTGLLDSLEQQLRAAAERLAQH